MTDTSAVEQVAQALWDIHRIRVGHLRLWAELAESVRSQWRSQAQAALTAAAGLGWVGPEEAGKMREAEMRLKLARIELDGARQTEARLRELCDHRWVTFDAGSAGPRRFVPVDDVRAILPPPPPTEEERAEREAVVKAAFYADVAARGWEAATGAPEGADAYPSEGSEDPEAPAPPEAVEQYRDPNSWINDQGEDICYRCKSVVMTFKDSSWACNCDSAMHEHARPPAEAPGGSGEEADGSVDDGEVDLAAIARTWDTTMRAARHHNFHWTMSQTTLDEIARLNNIKTRPDCGFGPDDAPPPPPVEATMFGLRIVIDDTTTGTKLINERETQNVGPLGLPTPTVDWSKVKLTAKIFHAWQPTVWETLNEDWPTLAARIPQEHRDHQIALRLPGYDQWHCATCNTSGEVAE